jgi:Zn-dependent oligopeptidase
MRPPMAPRRILAAAAALLGATAACKGGGARKEKPPAMSDAAAPVAPSAAQTFQTACQADLARAQAALPALLAVTGERTVANTLEPFNQLLISLANAAASASLFSEVHPDTAVQAAARSCEQASSSFRTELMLDRGLYDAPGRGQARWRRPQHRALRPDHAARLPARGGSIKTTRPGRG